MARRTQRPAGPLDPRSQAILRAVIDEYVATAEPVGSQTLVDRYRLGVSSATVRNVLAHLRGSVAGLPLDCVVRPAFLATLSSAQIARKLGSLPTRLRRAVTAQLKLFLG